jgi:Recombinase
MQMVDSQTAQKRIAAKREREQKLENKPLLRRTEASEYLREKHGLYYSPGTLCNYANRPLLGPPFDYIGGIPFYRRTKLDRWAKSRKGPFLKPVAVVPRTDATHNQQEKADARAEALRSVFEELSDLGYQAAAKELNKRGIKTAAGKFWRSNQVMRTRERLRLIDARIEPKAPAKRKRRPQPDLQEQA